MRELIKSYQQLLTMLEQRINYITQLMKQGGSKDSIKSLRQRRDVLREEYDDTVYALRKMSKYADSSDTHLIIREVSGA